MILMMDTLTYNILLVIFCIGFYSIQHIKNVKIRKNATIIVLLLFFGLFSFYYQTGIENCTQEYAFRTVCDCLKEDIPKEEILAGLEWCFENQKPGEHQRWFALRVASKMSSIYWDRKKEIEEKNIQEISQEKVLSCNSD